MFDLPARLPDPQRLLIDQMAAVQRTLPATIAGNLLLAAVLAWALQGAVPAAGLALWVGLVVLHCAANVWVLRATRRRPLTARNAPRRAAAAVRSAGVLGLVWAGGILLLWPAGDASLPQRFLLVFLVAGVSSGALHSLSPHLPTFTAFFVPTVAAVALAALREGGPIFHAVAGISVVYGIVTYRYAQSLNRTLLDAMGGRHELAALAERLRQEMQLVDQAQRARTRLLAAASHDLRQPVHALSLVLGLLDSEPLAPQAARRLKLAQQSVEALAAQFDALLDLARLEAGVMKAEPRRVQLAPLVLNLADALRPQAEARGLTLRVRVTGASVWTDPVLLERMLRNLLVNAIRYTDRGGVLMALRTLPGAGTGEDTKGGGARIEVVDTGIGIRPDQQSLVFDEFVQGEGAAGRGGLGLGLSVVQGCAALLGHALTLRSAPGRGSRFSIDIAPQDAPAQPAVHPPPHTSPGLADGLAAQRAPLHDANALEPLRGCLVALLEDDDAVRAATTEVLQRWGALVIAGPGLPPVLAQLVAQRQVPALLVVDGHLAGGASGIDAVLQLRQEYNDDQLPAVVISADAAALEQARSAGLVALRKPVSQDALAAALRQTLRR